MTTDTTLPDFAAKYEGADIKHVQPHTLGSVEECAYVMHRLDLAIGDIENQLDHAKANAAKFGEYSESDWFVNTKRALKGAKTTRSAVQERKGELSRRINRAFQRELSQRFIDVARTELPPDQFRVLMDRARQSAEVAA